MALRAVVVDELPLLRFGIEAAIASKLHIDVADTGATPSDAIRLAEHHRPDLVLIGIAKPEDSVAAVDTITRLGHARVICLTSVGAEHSVPMLLRAGARGCVSKAATAAELTRCIDSVLGGQCFVSPALAASVLCRPADARPSPPKPKPAATTLTERETEILKLVASGRSNRDIAYQLKLSEKTVKRYMTLIMQKIHVRNRVQAALYVGEVAIVE